MQFNRLFFFVSMENLLVHLIEVLVLLSISFKILSALNCAFAVFEFQMVIFGLRKFLRQNNARIITRLIDKSINCTTIG